MLVGASCLVASPFGLRAGLHAGRQNFLRGVMFRQCLLEHYAWHPVGGDEIVVVRWLKIRAHKKQLGKCVRACSTEEA